MTRLIRRSVLRPVGWATLGAVGPAVRPAARPVAAGSRGRRDRCIGVLRDARRWQPSNRSDGLRADLLALAGGEATRDRLARDAARVGVETLAVAGRLLGLRPHGEPAARSGLGIACRDRAEH